MASEGEIVYAAVRVVTEIVATEIMLIKRKKQKQWVREWITRRKTMGASQNFLREVLLEDPSTYFNHLRMDVHHFNFLLDKIHNKI